MFMEGRCTYVRVVTDAVPKQTDLDSKEDALEVRKSIRRAESLIDE